MAFLIGGANSAADTGFDVDNSCRFNDGDSAYMEKSPASDGSNTTATFSAWVKRGNLGARQAIFGGQEGTDTNNRCVMEFNASDQLVMQTGNGGSFVNKVSNRVFRDVSAWYHVVFQFDTTNGTAASRWKFFVNGAQETSLATDQTFPDSADIKFFENTTSCRIAVGMKPEGSNNVQFFDGYMAEVVVIDGTVVAPSSFGEYDEDSPTIWKPKDVSGLTFGTNGFYLDFEASDNLGNDANGGTDLTESNLAAIDQSTDSPTNNFCVMNSLANSFDPATFSEGNLSIVTETDGQSFKIATFGLSTGKWYWEIFRRGANGHSEIGIAGMPSDAADDYLGADAFTYAVHSDDGNWFTNGSGTSWVSAHNSAGTYPNHVCMVALDLDNNKFYFGINGTWEDSGDPTSGATGTGAQSIAAASTTPTGVWFPAISDKHNSYNTTLDMNFGGGAAFGATAVASANQDADGFGNFEFSVPSGYFSICSKNLAEYG